MERFTQENGNTKPLNPAEKVGLLFYGILWAQRKNFLESTLNKQQLIFLKKIVDKMSRGEKGTVSLLEMRRELFTPYTTCVQGSENLPKNGPFVIASNHYERGPLSGIWQVTAVAEVLNNNGLTSPRFIMDSTKPSVQKFPDANPQDILREKLEKLQPKTDSLANYIRNKTARDIAKDLLGEFFMNARAYTDFVPDTSFRKIIKGQLEHILFNMAASTNFIPTETHGREIIETLKKGGVLGIFPTAKAEYKLNRGVAEAGRLFRLAGDNHNAPIVPLGAWHNEFDRTFYINIGKPIMCSRDQTNQENVDMVMMAIANELPIEMWGWYKEQLQNRETRLKLIA